MNAVKVATMLALLAEMGRKIESLERDRTELATLIEAEIDGRSKKKAEGHG